MRTSTVANVPEAGIRGNGRGEIESPCADEFGFRRWPLLEAGESTLSPGSYSVTSKLPSLTASEWRFSETLSRSRPAPHGAGPCKARFHPELWSAAFCTWLGRRRLISRA